MKWLVCSVALVCVCAAAEAADSARLQLENWQMARMRIGGVVEFQTSVKNVSSDQIDKVVVSCEYFGDKGKLLGRTDIHSVTNAGRIDSSRTQGMVPQIQSDRHSPVTVRAPEVPAFARYVVTVNYEVKGEQFAEKFEGGQIGGEPPQRVLNKLVTDRLEVRIVTHDLSYVVLGKSWERKASLDLSLKNISAAEAHGLKVVIEIRKTGRLMSNKTIPLNPGVLKGGEEREYKVPVGQVPVYDSYNVSLAYDEPKDTGAGDAKSSDAGEVVVKDLKAGAGQGGRITGTVFDGSKKEDHQRRPDRGTQP